MEHRRNNRIVTTLLLFLPFFFITSCTKDLIGPLEEEEMYPIENLEPLSINSSTIPSFLLNDLGEFHSVNCRFHFTQNGFDYFVYVSNNENGSFLFKRIEKEWVLVDINRESRLRDARNYRQVDDYTFVIAQPGEGVPNYLDWGGYIWKLKIVNDKMTFSKITDVFEYWHSIGVGDLNGDGLWDVMSGSWVIIQNNDGTFKTYNLGPSTVGTYTANTGQYIDPNFKLFDTKRLYELKIPLEPRIVDLFPGGRKEVLLSFIDVSHNITEEEQNVPRGNFLIYEYNPTTDKYEVAFELPRRTVGLSESANSAQVADLNGDGINDIVLEISGEPNRLQPMEVWLGKPDKTFYRQQKFDIDVATSQFDLFDVNGDNRPDIILRARIDQGNLVRNWCTSECGERQQNNLPVKDGIFLHKAIYLNDGSGNFYPPQQEIIVDIPEGWNGAWIMPFMRNGNLTFHANNWINVKNDLGIADLVIFDLEINKNTIH